MPHSSSHVIISALTTPVSSNGKIKVWHYVAAACLLSYAIGYLVGKF